MPRKSLPTFTFASLGSWTEVPIASAFHFDKLDRIFEYEWDYANRLVHTKVSDNPEASLAARDVFAIDYFYDVLGNRIARFREGNEDIYLTTPDEREYFFSQMGKEIIVVNEEGKLLEHHFRAPMIDQLLAVDDFDYGPDPQAPTTTRQTIYPVADQQGSVRYMSSPDAPPPGLIQNQEQKISYSPFGVPNDAATEEYERGITDVVDVRYNGWRYDVESRLYFIGNQPYDANSGRLLTENTCERPVNCI